MSKEAAARGARSSEDQQRRVVTVWMPRRHDRGRKVWAWMITHAPIIGKRGVSMTQCTSEAFRGYLTIIEENAQRILDEIAEFRAEIDELEGKAGADGLCPYQEVLCKIAEQMFDG